MSSTERRLILIVEDSDEDFEAMLWALQKSSIEVPIVRCKDGEQAIDYLEKRGQYANIGSVALPAIILLDLNLPRTNGCQVLNHVRTSERLSSLPVIVVTTSANVGDVDACYRGGANSYVMKPVNMTKLRELMQGLIEYWFHLVILPVPEVSHGD